MGALSRHRYLVKARRFRKNQAEARARDALAAALKTKPAFYECVSCFCWHRVEQPCTEAARCKRCFSSGYLHECYGFSGWDRVPAP